MKIETRVQREHRKNVIVRDWFRYHVCTRNEQFPDWRMVWANPRSSFYSVHYIIYGSALFVTGDIGSAVYGFNQKLDWKFLADCELDYFASKCQASERGREYREWCESNAEAALLKTVQEWFEANEVIEQEEMIGALPADPPNDGAPPLPEGVEWRDLAEEQLEKVLRVFMNHETNGDFPTDSWSDLVEAVCGSPSDWRDFISANPRLFDEFEEADAGMDVAMRCRGHWLGLRMAYAQMLEQDRATPVVEFMGG